MRAGVVDQVTTDETEADALYVCDSTLKTGSEEASMVAFFNVGPYAFVLAVTRKRTLDPYSGNDLDIAVDAFAAKVRAGMRQ